MMKKNELKHLLTSLNIKPNKKLGQNFLIDENARDSIVNQADIKENDIILEIGPGFGALTESLIKKAQKVIAIELDKHLYDYLSDNFSYASNLTLLHTNILQTDLPKVDKVVSNIPYSITGPLLEKVFFRNNAPEGTICMEKTLAEKILDYSEYKKKSRISINVNAFLEPCFLSNISRYSFYPLPKIDLSLLRFYPREGLSDFLTTKENRKFFLSFIAGIFPYKNKNLVNAISYFLAKTNKIEKYHIKDLLSKNDIENNKVFSYTIPQLIEVSRIINKFIDARI